MSVPKYFKNFNSIMHVLNVRTSRGRKFFQKSNNHLTIVVVRRVTGSKVHKMDSKNIKLQGINLVTTAILIIKPTRCPNFSNLFLE